MDTVKFSRHDDLMDLPTPEDKPNIHPAKGYKPVEYNFEQLDQHVKQGSGFGAIYNDNHRKAENFISSQLMFLDFDKNVDIPDVLSNAFITQFECWIGNTISHTPENPRSRVILPLDKAITNRDDYMRLQNKLLYAVNELNPDTTSNEADRFYFGIKNAIHNPGKQFTIAELELLPDSPETNEKGEFVERADFNDNVYGESVKSAIEYIENLTDDRNYSGCYKPAYLLSKQGELSDNQIEQLIYAANVTNGYVKKHGKTQAIASIRSGIRNGKAAKAKTVPIPQIKADLTLNKQYLELSDIQPFLDAGYDLVIQSDMGTGKTSLIREIIKDESVISIVHRQSLAEDNARKLNTKNYRDVNGKIRSDKELRESERLTIVANSVYKTNDMLEGISPKSKVVADEIDQELAHIFGDTLDVLETEKAYTTQCAHTAKAGQILASSAHINDIVIEHIKTIRGADKVKVIVNTYQRPKGTITPYKSKDRLFAKIKECLANGICPIALACSSIEETEICGKQLKDLLGDDCVTVLNGDTTDSEKQRIIKNINDEVLQRKVIIFSPTLGSGVDIQTRIKAIFGIFNANPITATECHQMLNRFRNVDETHIWLDPTKQHLETNWETIYSNYFNNSNDSNKFYGDYDSTWNYKITDRQLEMLKLEAKLEAFRNEQLNDLSGYFKAYATGYTWLPFNTEDDEIAHEQTLKTEDEIQANKKERILNSKPVTNAEFDSKRESGLVTDEIRYGNRRYKIERCAGQEITSELYDLLHDQKEQDKVYLLKDMLFESEWTLIDKGQMEIKGDLSKQHNNRLKVALLNDLVDKIFGDLDSSIFVYEDDVEARMKKYLNLVGNQVYRVFNKRNDESKDYVSILRSLLDKIGLKLKAKRKQVNGEKFYVYHLDDKTLKLMMKLAQQNYAKQLLDTFKDFDEALEYHLERFNENEHVIKSGIQYSGECGDQFPTVQPNNDEIHKVANSCDLYIPVQHEFATLPKASVSIKVKEGVLTQNV